MKRLIIALVAAVAVSTGFARVTIQEGFESETPDFPGISSGDASVVSYETADTSHALYPFANGGSKYLELDTEGTVSCVNSSGASYFDMYMQFNPSTTAPELDEDTKIAVYMNSDGKLVVIDAADTNVTQTALTAGDWYRLTIAAKTAGFDVLLDGTLVGTYTPITGDATITSVGFKGSGALDNFVARTTDPFLQNPAVMIAGEGYATNQVAEALGEAAAGSTVTLLQNATGAGAISTAAGTLDLNGKKLGATGITFTGTGAKTLKGGDVVDSYNTITITAPADEDLTLDGVTFHASVTPAGSGDVLLVTNCTFLCDKDTSGKAFVEGATAHSYGILFSSATQFGQADVVNNRFAQARRAAVQASYGNDLYFYGNTVDGTVNTVASGDGLSARYPALQIFSNGRVFMENNTFSGQYIGEAFCIYNKGAYRSTDAAVVFSGNTVDNTVPYLWGVYDVDKSGTAALTNNVVYFGANTIGANVNTTQCVYKTTIDGVDMNGVTYSHTPATLALPAGVASVYAWTHADGAKDFYVDGTPADAVAAGTIIAVPGVEVADTAALKLTPDATLKNQYTAAAWTWADYLGVAVDGAYEIDNLAELKAFQANVGVLATAGETFKLTDDIALDAAWPGIGVKNGKDIWNQTSFNDGAFCGTFDGQNHTISGFQMVGGGLDYCGFFNSIYGATIKNLQIQYKDALFANDTTASTLESGATFVGVAKESTLQNLTSLQKDSSTAVSCSKGFGGIVGFVTSGTTVEYCTNNVNMTSLASNKAGGIAMITQGGTGTATIRNCVNNGTTAGNNTQKGGIIGYVGTDGSVAIADCTDTAGSAPTFLCWNKGTVTVSGVNKAPASVVPVKNQSNGTARAVSGLTFATVDNGVATFVADNALAAGNTYKVMAPGTAAYEFDAAGTIAFDTALAKPTYAITVPNENLWDLTDATEGTVKTYTAAGGTAVATIVTGDVTNSYNTIQKAITAAAAGDTKTVDLVANAAISGEVNIPADVTVVLASGVSLGNVTALSGTGVLFVPSGPLVPLVQTNHAASLLRDAEKWAGTLFIKDATMTGPDGLAYYGNANSTVRFENVWLNKYSSSHAIGTLELVGAGVYIQTTSGNMTLPCALVGDGSISLRDASETQRTVLFSGDVSAFAGNVTVATDTKSRIVFGTNASTQGNDNCIVVDSGASVTVAEGKTWTAPNGYVIKGTATVSGTLAAGSEKVYGAGCVIYTSATAAAASAPIAGSWTGTYVVGWAPTGAFNPNTYGNANSTVVLSNDLAESAYFGPGSATTLTISPTLRIAADVEIKNGYSKADDSCLVTFTKLTGDHKFSTSPGTGGTDANPTTRRYAITTLDNFTGSLKVKAGSELRIATVNVADGTDLSGRIISAECDAKATVSGANADGAITGALALTVAGADSGKKLEYKDGAQGAGLYVKADDWNTPAKDEDVATSLEEDGISTDSGAVTTVEEFNALVEYITNTVSGAVAPTDLSANQKANAVLCYALNATSIPDAAITDSDITIDSVEQTGDAGAVALTVAIAGVTVGQTVDSTVLAKVVTAKGGTDLKSLSAENVDVSGHGAANGKVAITVTPKKVNPSDPAPTSFFTSVIINK